MLHAKSRHAQAPWFSFPKQRWWRSSLVWNDTTHPMEIRSAWVSSRLKDGCVSKIRTEKDIMTNPIFCTTKGSERKSERERERERAISGFFWKGQACSGWQDKLKSVFIVWFQMTFGGELTHIGPRSLYGGQVQKVRAAQSCITAVVQFQSFLLFIWYQKNIWIQSSCKLLSFISHLLFCTSIEKLKSCREI